MLHEEASVTREAVHPKREESSYGHKANSG